MRIRITWEALEKYRCLGITTDPIEALEVGSSGIFFLLFPRCLSCPAKVESLWPKEHPSTSKELKKTHQKSLTLLSNTSLRSHRAEHPSLKSFGVKCTSSLGFGPQMQSWVYRIHPFTVHCLHWAMQGPLLFNLFPFTPFSLKFLTPLPDRQPS